MEGKGDKLKSAAKEIKIYLTLYCSRINHFSTFAVYGEDFSQEKFKIGSGGDLVDLVNIGKFIAKLRKERDMTQEQLGEVLGVTNKTISRWENGNYMPSIEMLQLLSQTFEVSINELLAGKYISDKDLSRQADQKLENVVIDSALSFEEQRRFLIHKWEKDHISLTVAMFLIPIALTILFLSMDIDWGLGLIPFLWLIELVWGYIKMMIYVENQLYGKNKK